MSFEAWPSPESRRGPLPRIEDLPVAEQGYDQEAVRRAFDDFYRHAAQLDASLKALEAVEAFRRDAAELRSDLRSLRALGFGGADAGWPTISPASSWTYERPPSDVPVAALRIAAEIALIVGVAVVAGVAHLRAWVIVALMAAALAVVWLCEWLASRARTRVATLAYESVVYDEPGYVEPAGEPAPYVEAPAIEAAVGWSAFEPPPEDVDDVAGVTIVEEPPADTDEHVIAQSEPPGEQAGAEVGDEPPEATPSNETPADAEKPARGWFRRRRPKDELALNESDAEREPPTHVRVLTPGDDVDAEVE